MMKTISKIFTILLVLCQLLSYANDPKKYDKFIEKADRYYDNFVYPKAIELYEKALEEKENSFDPYAALKIADSYRLMNKPLSAEKWYSKLEGTPVLTDQDKMNYAKMLLQNGKDQKAQEIVSTIEREKVDLKRMAEIGDMEEFYLDSAAYLLENMNINSDQNDFGPTYYDEGLVFVSNRKNKKLHQNNYYWDDTYFLDLYYTKIANGENLKPEPLSKRINTIFHEGPAVFFDEGRQVIFTRNNFNLGKRGASVEGINKLKLYHAAKRKNGTWDKALPLPFNSDEYSVGHPTLSTDEKTLYFSSDMKGTFGKADIYKSTFENGQWSTPVNLGEQINTPEDELFPYIGEDNVLYFASEGHHGIGGLDIYKVDLNDPALEVHNLGYPVNSPNDDFGFVIKGDEGYLSSNRDGGAGSDDIYKVNLYKLLVRSQLVDAESGEPVPGNLTVSDLRDSTQIVEMEDAEVSPAFELLRGRKLLLMAASEGYLPNEYVFNSATIPVGIKEYMIEVPMERIHTKGDILVVTNPGMDLQVLSLLDAVDLYAGTLEELKADYVDKAIDLVKVYEVQSIYYDFDKSNIREDAAEELDQLVDILKRYEEIKVVLRSHTDSRGNKSYNEHLAKARAKSAVEYMVGKGISPDRISMEHFGESRLLNDCGDDVECDEDAHQTNRRTEVIIKE